MTRGVGLDKLGRGAYVYVSCSPDRRSKEDLRRQPRIEFYLPKVGLMVFEFGGCQFVVYPEGPCTQIVYTLALK